MLTQLDFKNFKAWRKSSAIRLAPITVFFGGNSAGKTSIPQLFLLLKQTAESPDRQRALQLGDNRTLVDLGTFHDVLHNYNVEDPLEFSFEWSVEPVLEITDPLSGNAYEGDRVAFTASIQADKRHQPIVKSMEYRLLSDEDTSLVLRMGRQEGGKFTLSSENYSLVRHPGRVWPTSEPVRFYGFPPEVTAHYQNTAFAADLVLELERLLRGIFYVGPLREYPRRLYLWSGEVPDHVGEKGDRAIEAILASGDRHFNFKPRQKTKSLGELVAERLEQMGLIQEFRVEPLGEHRKEYEVLVRTNTQLPLVRLTDVGFGVSQVLPVIVECFYVPSKSVVIFEQPEIHLHPRVQAELADLFIDAIHAREDSADRGCQFIIESHSEHFLRRLQRRIADEKLQKEEAALYFVHQQDDSAQIEELVVDDYGNITNWPQDFFGDEMADLVARAEAQAERTKKKRKSAK